MSDRTVPARRGNLRESVITNLVQQTAGLDPDLWVVMDKRDNTLIEEEILHGAGSSKFVYNFTIAGSGTVNGISVVGARELAAKYGGIQHKLIGSISKIGSMFIMKSYQPMDVRVQILPELATEEDFYEVLVEVKDVKTGNVLMVEKRENRYERRRDGTMVERLHYQTIAGSKAFRNGVLSIIPQSIQIEWKEQMILLNKTDVITGSMIDEKRSGVLRYAAAKAIGVDRAAVESLTYDQIAGLSDAVKEGRTEQFVEAAEALGIVVGGADLERKPAARTVQQTKSNGQTQQQETQAGPGNGQTTQTAKPQAAATKATKTTSVQTEKPPVEVKQEKQPDPPREEQQAGRDQQVDQQEIAADQTDGPFDHYPLDVYGEPILLDAATGELLNFIEPLDFANWFAKQMAGSPNREALIENNADALAEAFDDPAAKIIINDAMEPPPADPPKTAADPATADAKPAETTQPPGKQPVAVPSLPNGRPNWAKYGTLCEAELKACKTDAEVSEWVALNNVTTYGKMYAGKVEDLIAARRKLIAAGNGDADMDRANGLISDLNGAQDQAAYASIVNNAAMRSFAKRMTTERPDIRAMIETADAVARARTLPQATAETGDPRDEPPPRESDAP